MTKKDFTSIIFVLDKSASMSTKREQAVSSFDEFVLDQKNQKGECSMTLVMFDTNYGVILVNEPIEKVKPLEEIGYAPGGNTALIDSVARAINEAGDVFARMKEGERPDNVVLVILTDGEENSSKEVTNQELQQLIDHQVDKYDWKIVYLHQGAGAFAQANKMGMKAMHSNYFVGEVKTGGGLGVRKAMRAASYAVASTRSSDSKSMDKGGTEDLLSDDDAYDRYRSKQAVTSSTRGNQ